MQPRASGVVPAAVRALIVVICSCALAHAAPKHAHVPSTSTDPAMVAAERAWTIAAASRGPAQSDLWLDAAVAFIAIAEARTLPEAELVHAARAARAALERSIAVDARGRVKPPAKFDPDPDHVPVPQELAPRDQRMIRVLDVAERYETADERPSLAFMRATVWRRHDHLDKAIAIYLDIIANHPAHEVAEPSANLALDSYNRLHRYDDLLALAGKLRRDKKLLANRPELEKAVTRLHVQGQRKVAQHFEQQGRQTGDRRFFERCGEAYLALVDPSARQTEDDVMLYNALVCFEAAGAIERMLDVQRRMVSDVPSSLLTKSADARVIALLGTIGRTEEAAAAGERWLRTNSLESGAADVLEDTIRWRAALGDLDGALRILDAFSARTSKVAHLAERAALTAISLAEHFLDNAQGKPAAAAARDRAVAARLVARPPRSTRSNQIDAGDRIAIARVIAAAACPVPLVDDLCPRVRDAALVAAARRELARVSRPNDEATLFLADLALEAILARRAPTANLDADYRYLASSANPDVRVAALARLAALAKHTGDLAEHERQLAVCITEAYVSRAGDPWRAICERALSASDAVRERLPAATAPNPIAIEVLPARKPPVPHRRDGELHVFELTDDVIKP